MTGGTIGGTLVADLILGGGLAAARRQLPCPQLPSAPPPCPLPPLSLAALCSAGADAAGRPPPEPAGRPNPWAGVYDPSRAPPAKSLIEARRVERGGAASGGGSAAVREPHLMGGVQGPSMKGRGGGTAAREPRLSGPPAARGRPAPAMPPPQPAAGLGTPWAPSPCSRQDTPAGDGLQI